MSYSIFLKTRVNDLIIPDWPCAGNVKALFTLRSGGVSEGAYRSLNLAQHVGDSEAAVSQNRLLVSRFFPDQPLWLNQVHSNRVINLDEGLPSSSEADAALTTGKGQVLAVMAADCLPILLASRRGDRIGVVHAGWRGLAEGVIANAVGERGDEWMAWLGPAIGPCHYEVGDEVRNQFAGAAGFERSGLRWMMNLSVIATQQLNELGVKDIHGGNFCTYCDAERFYSYRRDGVTGRMAGFIWLE